MILYHVARVLNMDYSYVKRSLYASVPVASSVGPRYLGVWASLQRKQYMSLWHGVPSDAVTLVAFWH